MKYIAKKVKKEYEVSGIKEMETIDGTKVEVIFATKMYDKDKLKEVMKKYEEEMDLMQEKYQNDIMDLKMILDAIEEAK